MHEFNASDGDRGAPKALQSKHWTKRSLIDRWSCSIRLFKYFEDRNFGPLAAPMLPEDFPRRPMRSLVAIKRDRAWRPPLVLERPPEKRLGGRDIPFGAEQEIDSLSLLVDRAIEVR